MRFDLLRRYQRAVQENDADAILELFESDALVFSPLNGASNARAFHSKLFSKSSSSIVRLLNVFESVGRTPAVALHFSYTWILQGGVTLVIDGVTVFEVDEELGKFKSMVLIYDTAQLRRHLTQSQIEDLRVS